MKEERLKQLESMMRQKIDIIIRSELSDPRLALMSIVEIKLSKELDNASIYVSHPGDDETRKAVVKILQTASKFIEKNLARATRLRRTPNLVFKLDNTLAQAARIDQLLETIKSENKSETKDESEKREDIPDDKSEA